MKFLFLGAGAIGTYIGGSLAIRGEDVTFIERPDVVDVIAERGLVVHRGNYTRSERRVSLFTTAAEALAAGPYDVCVFALKSFDTASAIADLIATGLPVPPVLSLQNGVDNETILAEALGAENVISGTVCSAVGKPGIGEIVEEKHRGIGIAAGHELSERLVQAFSRAGLNARLFDNQGSMKWSKLITNLTGNATSAILDMTVAELFSDKRIYALEREMMLECLAVMDALGYKAVDLPGTPVKALTSYVFLPRFIAQPAMVKVMGAGRGDKMPSFHIDLHAGRSLEVEWLNGAVVKHGQAVGVDTPINRALTETMLDLGAGRESLDDFRKNPEMLLRRVR